MKPEKNPLLLAGTLLGLVLLGAGLWQWRKDLSSPAAPPSPGAAKPPAPQATPDAAPATSTGPSPRAASATPVLPPALPDSIATPAAPAPAPPRPAPPATAPAPAPPGSPSSAPSPAPLPKDGEVARLLSRRVDLTDPVARAGLVAELQRAEQVERAATVAKARQLNIPLVTGDGAVLAGFEGDMPLYEASRNINAAISTATDLVRDTAPYGVNGLGYIIGLWEVTNVPRTTHVEFQGRVTLNDDATAVGSHATHVAGTLIAAGLNPSLEGMAPAATIYAHSSTSVVSEMAAIAAAAPGVPGTTYVSNHSYGYITGWNTSPWNFYGTFVNDGNPANDYPIGFGRYAGDAASWDGIAWNAPYFLIFKTADNDRNDDHPGTGTSWRVNGGGTTYTYNPAIHPLADFEYLVDGSVTGFGTVTERACSKNVMTVGSVNDAVSGGLRNVSSASLSDFSNAGPTDDGRIKPDLVANGESLTSTDSGSNSATGIKSGTSMASPNACGAALLLQDYYDDRFPGEAMLASMLKGLMLHTADDLGNPGPDYRFGWGLLNLERAAALIKNHADSPSAPRMIEKQLNAATASRTEPVIWNGADPIRVTLCWTDPPGPFTTAHDSRTRRLVHDLNLKLTSPDGATEFLPYVMPWVGDWTGGTLNDNATTGINTVDNVEQVYLASPPAPGAYTVTVDHAGSLSSGPQDYALVISGGSVPTGFARWAAGNFPVDIGNPSIAGFDAAPGGSGIANGLRYAFDLSGAASASSSEGTEGDLYTLGSETVGPDTFITLTYDRDNSKTDISYHVEWSNDLDTWNLAAGIVESTEGAIDTMKASILFTGDPLFARLVVTKL